MIIDKFFILTVVAVLFCCIGTLYLSYKVLLWRIKNNLYKNAPRVEMTMCDKGHYYPKDLSFTLDIPEVAFPVELCPICYDTNTTNALAILKQHGEEDVKSATAKTN